MKNLVLVIFSFYALPSWSTPMAVLKDHFENAYEAAEFTDIDLAGSSTDYPQKCVHATYDDKLRHVSVNRVDIKAMSNSLDGDFGPLFPNGEKASTFTSVIDFNAGVPPLSQQEAEQMAETSSVKRTKTDLIIEFTDLRYGRGRAVHSYRRNQKEKTVAFKIDQNSYTTYGYCYRKQ